MKQSQKLLISLLILGLSFIVLLGSIIYRLNSGDFLLAKKQAYPFLKLISNNNYLDAFKYVDSSKISINDLQAIGKVATHYFSDATYFNQSSKDVYIIGFKPIKDDKDPINDNKLEFIISKVKGEWKVTYISYRH
jgi:hypothetical protein